LLLNQIKLDHCRGCLGELRWRRGCFLALDLFDGVVFK
jgi:hypothetical protein